ncbi:MAG: DeoR family transcriptional regulator [Candidatus Wildermuthbacteria bacterium]|nr:DeoR family transcriptional regulator [Candidatus Wildermuthbacteria bacterium]
MAISDRQKQILFGLISEYTRLAEPISSETIEQNCHLGVSPATIRNDMKELTEEGFLFQPHTSAGRIPADKGYRLFVDELLEKQEKRRSGKFSQVFEGLENEMDDPLGFTRVVTRVLALTSANLSITYLVSSHVLWKEGWEDILQAPEFSEQGIAVRFAKLLKDFEENIEGLEAEDTLSVYIGEEITFSEVNDFSLVIADCSLPEGQEGRIAILGPKRMEYTKNIGLMKSLLNFLDDNKS